MANQDSHTQMAKEALGMYRMLAPALVHTTHTPENLMGFLSGYVLAMSIFAHGISNEERTALVDHWLAQFIRAYKDLPRQ